MGWLKFLLQRKLVVGLTVIFVLITGLYSNKKMDTELLPKITMDMAAIYVNAGQMSSLDVEEKITKVIEKKLSAMDGVDSYTSITTLGNAQIIVTFQKDKGEEVFPDMDATLKAMEKDLLGVKEIRNFLASTVNESEFFMDIYGGDIEEMTTFAKNVVKKRLEALPEVREVQVLGGTSKEVIIELKTKALAKNGVSTEQILNILQRENQNLAIGDLTDEKNEPKLRWDTSLKNIEDLKRISIPTARGMKKLEDLANIELAIIDEEASISKNGNKNYIFLQIGRTDNTTQIGLAQAIRAEVEKIKKEGLVEGFQFEEVVSQADYVSDAIEGVKSNVIIGGLLALVILLVFLRNIRATLIIGLSIPISLLLTFTSMWVFGYTINMISLIALGLGIGMMVDASIVILESIYRKRQLGLGKFEAAIEGTKEVSAAVIASMLTTIVVFLPIGLLSGEMGEFMLQLSMVVIITLVSSVIISFTLIPTLAESLLKLKEKEIKAKRNLISAKYSSFVLWMSVKKRRAFAISLLFLLIFATSLTLVAKVPTALMPDVYNRQAEVLLFFESETTPKEREEAGQEVHNRLKLIPDIESYTISVGSSNIFVFINMTPEEEATLHQKEVNERIMTSLREMIGDYPLTEVGAPMGMTGSSYPVNIEIKGKDFAEMQSIALGLKERLEGIEGLVGVKSSMQKMSEELVFQFDHSRIEKDKLIPAQIREQLELAFVSRPIGEMEIETEVFPMKLKVDREITNREELNKFEIQTWVEKKKLSRYVDLKSIEVPNEINRADGERVVHVRADIENRDLGSINRDVQKVLDDFKLPMGYTANLSGQLEEQQKAFTEMMYILIIAIFLVFVVMAIQFNSLVHPLVVMSVIPMTFVGVILGLLLTGRELSIIAAVGVVMLIGIVLNNAILLIDRTRQLREEGKTRGEALAEAGQTRMRPIFMTTLTTVFGMLPLAMATGNASNFQTPMATVVISGLLFATLVTLLLIPSVYIIFEDIFNWPKKVLLKLFKKKAQKIEIA